MTVRSTCVLKNEVTMQRYYCYTPGQVSMHSAAALAPKRGHWKELIIVSHGNIQHAPFDAAAKGVLNSVPNPTSGTYTGNKTLKHG